MFKNEQQALLALSRKTDIQLNLRKPKKGDSSDEKHQPALPAMSVLVIGSKEQRAIHDAIERARAKPTPWALAKAIADGTPTPTMMLKDRKPGTISVRIEYPPQNVMLGTYRAAISFEEQPAGLIRHLSVSSHAKGKVPGRQVMAMVCAEFGFSKPLCRALISSKDWPLVQTARAWVEEYEPGHFAINVIEIVP